MKTGEKEGKKRKHDTVIGMTQEHNLRKEDENLKGSRKMAISFLGIHFPWK